MAISVVQSAQNAVNSTTNNNVLNVTLANTPAVGNLLLTFGGTDSSLATVQTGMTLIDSSTTNWEVLDQYRVVQSGDGKSWPCIKTSATTNQTVSGVVYEIAGAASSSFINAHNQSNSTSSGASSPNTMTTATITPTVDGCLIVACAFYGVTGTVATTGAVTVNGSFAVDQKVNNVTTSTTFGALMVTASFVQSTAAAVSCTFTNNNGSLQTTANDTFIVAIAPGAAQSQGSLSETLGNATALGSGQVVVSSSLGSTLGSVTPNAAAQVIDSGLLSQTLGAAILSDTVTVESTGSLNEVFGSLSINGVAKVIGTVTLSEAFGAMQSAANGLVKDSASASISLNPATLLATGHAALGFVVPPVTVIMPLSAVVPVELSLANSLALMMPLEKFVPVNLSLQTIATLSTDLSSVINVPME